MLLLELLVGMAIGVMAMGTAIASLFIARNATVAVSDMAQLQQQGAYAMRIIGAQLRQAGSLDLQVASTGAGSLSVFEFVDGFAGLAGGTSFIQGTEGAGTRLDTLTVGNLPAPLLPSLRFDCLGQSMTARNDATFAVDKANLRCKASSAQNQPLVDGVADFRVSYRVRDGDNVRAMHASDVQKAGLWPAVTAVEVCLDLQGDEQAPQNDGSYTDCRGKTVARNGRLHLVLRNLFNLRTQTGADA